MDKFIINIFNKFIMIIIIFTFCYVLKLVINLMFTCPVLILLYAWLTLTFQCEYSDFCSLLSIGHTALGIVFLSSSDQFYLDIWLYKLCNFIILSMWNKLSWELHIGHCQQIIRSVIALKLYSDVNNKVFMKSSAFILLRT